MIKLYPDQQILKNKIMQAWGRVRSVLAVLPTGGGKTIVFSDIIHDHNGSAAAIVHRREIVRQISISLAKLEVKHRIIAPPKTIRSIRRKHLKLFGRSFVDPNARCGVASVQTLTSRSAENNQDLQAWIKQITLCVYDEGHHYVKSGLWAKAVACMSKAKLLFVSATPERADGKGLGSHADGFVDEMVEGENTGWLIAKGRLSRFTYYAPDSDIDISDVPVTASGDFNASAFRAKIVDSKLVGNAVKHYFKFAKGKRTIVFATDVKTAEEIAAEFRLAGIRCKALNGGTEEGEREAVLDEFERGAIDVLVNVDLFDEGFDLPAVECVLQARPTQSLQKYLQQIGRSLRVMEGKDRAIIIDMVGNWETNGMPDWPRVWSLDGREKGSRETGKDTVPQVVCKKCTQPYEAFYKACPYCGHIPVPAGRSLPEHVDGDLQELDVEALAALFKKKQAANMSDADYEQDQIKRNLPLIARGQDLKRHRAAKYRRGVLQNVVAWWVGFQPSERDMGEIHRRFYHRFKVDIVSAFTLNQKETDALIERIQKGFHYDIS